MTIDAFIDLCERSFSEKKVRLGPSQHSIYHEKMRRFSPEQIDAIFEKCLETTRNFPKIKDIYDSANELGFLVREVGNWHSHKWELTDCNLCRGEGRLMIVWEMEFTETKREIHKLKRIGPYSAADPNLGPGEITSVYRCRCLAGEKASIPKTWPRWTKDSEPVRYA